MLQRARLASPGTRKHNPVVDRLMPAPLSNPVRRGTWQMRSSSQPHSINLAAFPSITNVKARSSAQQLLPTTTKIRNIKAAYHIKSQSTWVKMALRQLPRRHCSPAVESPVAPSRAPTSDPSCEPRKSRRKKARIDSADWTGWWASKTKTCRKAWTRPVADELWKRNWTKCRKKRKKSTPKSAHYLNANILVYFIW